MQRYKIRCNDCDPKITPHENGKWVRWGDVERLRAELAECKLDAERYRWVLENWDTGGPDFGKIMFSSAAETLSADIDTARKGEGE